jgi:hypothetical protein
MQTASHVKMQQTNTLITYLEEFECIHPTVASDTQRVACTAQTSLSCSLSLFLLVLVPVLTHSHSHHLPLSSPFCSPHPLSPSGHYILFSDSTARHPSSETHTCPPPSVCDKVKHACFPASCFLLSCLHSAIPGHRGAGPRSRSGRGLICLGCTGCAIFSTPSHVEHAEHAEHAEVRSGHDTQPTCTVHAWRARVQLAPHYTPSVAWGMGLRHASPVYGTARKDKNPDHFECSVAHLHGTSPLSSRLFSSLASPPVMSDRYIVTT